MFMSWPRPCNIFKRNPASIITHDFSLHCLFQKNQISSEIGLILRRVTFSFISDEVKLNQGNFDVRVLAWALQHFQAKSGIHHDFQFFSLFFLVQKKEFK